MSASDRNTLPARMGRSGRELIALAAALAGAALPVALDGRAVAAAAALYKIAEGAHPFFAPAYGWLLYIRLPLVVLSSICVLLGPGLLLASALGATGSWSRWLLSGLTLSLVVVSGAAGVAQWLTAAPLVGGYFLILVSGCTLAAAVIAFARTGAVERMLPPLSARRATEAAIAIWFILVLLLPKFLWENFNGDGADALEVARLLLHHGFPFWPRGAGTVSSFPGVTSMLFAYPASWFVRLFGPLEIAVRLPMLLALLGSHAGLVALAETDVSSATSHHRELGRSDRCLIWAGLLLYTIVVAYSATYSPYSADIAIPGAQDTMFVAMLTGTIITFATAEVGWMALFGALSYVALPSGLLLLGMLVLAGLVIRRPLPKRVLLALSALIIAYALAGALAPRLLQVEGLPGPGSEYAGSNLLQRLLLIQFTDWRRLLYVVIPCGITPVVALFLWKRQDQLSRVLTLIVVGYFVFTYLQAYSILHYYIPAMLLPMAVYWRTAPADRAGHNEWRIAAVAGLCGATVLSLPEHAKPFVAAREIAAGMESVVPGYDSMAPSAFLASDALQAVFPMDWDKSVPATLGGSPLVWNYYLHQVPNERQKPNYVLDSATSVAPLGFHALGGRNGFVVFVRDDSLLARQRKLPIPVDPGSPVFRIQPGILFRYATSSDGAPIHDILAPLARPRLILRKIWSHL